MLDYFSKITLLITNPFVGALLLSFIYIFINLKGKKLVNMMMVIFYINALSNAFLKGIFATPLHPSLNNPCWFSFPSGHIQYILVFCGMIWINNKLNLKVLLSSILLVLLGGWGIYYNDYHNVVDMLGAIPPTILVLYGYFLLRDINNLNKVNIIASVAQLLVIFFIKPSPCENYKYIWLWLHLGMSLGFTIFHYNIDKLNVKKVKVFSSKLVNLILGKGQLLYNVSRKKILIIIIITTIIAFIFNYLHKLCNNELISVIAGIAYVWYLFTISKFLQKTT